MKPTRLSLHALMYIIGLFTLTTTVARSATYDVGPNKPYPRLSAVPWSSLMAGDTVNIHWQPQPYREKLLLSCRGTAAAPIRILGVPGPAGQLPVISGDNATTSAQFHYPYAPTQDRGLVIVSLNKQQAWGYKPGYLEINNLDLRNAAPPNTYTDGQGNTRSYNFNAASLFVERGEHIKVHGCTITGSGNGFFVASGGGEENQSRDITVENCAIYGNGNVGRDREHNIYTEAIGVTFQYNYLGRPRAGAWGNNLKDRSAGTIIRYNWIEGGGHLLDLVEAQDSVPLASAEPSYRETFVYGNVLVDGPGDAANLVHYGGDNGNTSTYRKGTLYFYHNTVAVRRNQTGAGGAWRTTLLDVSTNDESVQASNNLLFSQAYTAGRTPTECALVTEAGHVTFDTNWISPNWLNAAQTYTPFAGKITVAKRLSNKQNDPGFISLANAELHLAPNSPCIGAGGALPVQEQGAFAVYYQYAAPMAGMRRLGNAMGPDLGAFGYGMPLAIPAYTISGNVTNQGQGLAGVTVTASNGFTANTAADGSYTINGLPADVYTVSAEKNGYAFRSEQFVDLNGNETGLNFTATASTPSGGDSSGSGSGTNLLSLTLDTNKIKAYDRPNATITLNTGVPNNYITVSLTSSNPSVVQVGDVAIWAPLSAKTVQIATGAVTQPTNVTITATYAGVSKTVTLTVMPR